MIPTFSYTRDEKGAVMYPEGDQSPPQRLKYPEGEYGSINCRESKSTFLLRRSAPEKNYWLRAWEIVRTLSSEKVLNSLESFFQLVLMLPLVIYM